MIFDCDDKATGFVVLGYVLSVMLKPWCQTAKILRLASIFWARPWPWGTLDSALRHFGLDLKVWPRPQNAVSHNHGTRWG